MDLLSALEVLWRRKWVVLPLFGLSIILGALVIIGLKPDYVASGDMVVLSPNTVTDTNNKEIPQNPLSGFTDSSRLTAGIVVTRLNSNQVRQEFQNKGLASNYTIPQPTDPIITLSAKSSSADVAKNTVAALQKETQRQLNDVQASAGAPEIQRYGAKPAVAEIQVSQKSTAKTRVGIGVFALGITAAIGAAFLAEGIAVAKRRRKQLNILVPLSDEELADANH